MLRLAWGKDSFCCVSMCEPLIFKPILVRARASLGDAQVDCDEGNEGSEGHEGEDHQNYLF